MKALTLMSPCQILEYIRRIQRKIIVSSHQKAKLRTQFKKALEKEKKRQVMKEVIIQRISNNPTLHHLRIQIGQSFQLQERINFQIMSTQTQMLTLLRSLNLIHKTSMVLNLSLTQQRASNKPLWLKFNRLKMRMIIRNKRKTKLLSLLSKMIFCQDNPFPKL